MAAVVQIDAYDPVADAPVTLRAASHDDRRVCMIGDQVWWPVLTKLPALAYDLFDGAFDAGQITDPTASLSMMVDVWPDLARYSLGDAQVQIWTGSPDAPWEEWVRQVNGRVASQPKIQDLAADFDITTDSRWLDAPLLATYAGSGGIEGTLDLAGAVKPLALGAPRYVSGTLIDAVNSVYQISAYGPIHSVDVAMDKLVRFQPAASDFATLDALVAATIAPGTWATCLASGLVRFGAPPDGQVSFLVQGDVAGPDGLTHLPGETIRRLALLSGGAGKVADASLDALDAARPWPISLAVTDQTTARELIQSIAVSVNAVAGVLWTGGLFVAPIDLGEPQIALKGDGSALPLVSSVTQANVDAPWWKLSIGAVRCWTVHSTSDIDFSAPLNPRGDYDPLATYRDGDIVKVADGTRWLYIADTPGSGVAPPDFHYWEPFDPTPQAVLDQLAAIESDSVLSRGEKPQVIRDWADIQNEASVLDTQAAELAVDASTLDAARQALQVYLASLSPAWNDTGHDTAIDTQIFNGKWTDYYFARAALETAMAEAASKTAEWSGIHGPGKPVDGATRNVPTGPYDATRTYQAGDEATDQGAAWLYINAAPSKGHKPPTLPTESDAYWQLYVLGTSQDIIDAVAGITSDRILARSEKSALILNVTAIQSEYPRLNAQASDDSIDASDYDAAYTALMAYLNGLHPDWDDTTQDTPLSDNTTLLTRFEAYFSQRDELQASIADVAALNTGIAKSAADAAAAAATQAGTLANTANQAAALGAQMAADIADNGKFSSAEKKRWVERINSLDGVVATEITDGNQLGLQSSTAALQSAYTNLKNYLNSVNYTDVGHTTSINSATFKANVAAFDNAQANLAYAANAYQQSMSVIVAGNLIVDPLFQRPTDAGAWQQPLDTSTAFGQDDIAGRRICFNPSSGDKAWAIQTFQLGGNDRIDIDFDVYFSSGLASAGGGVAAGIWVSGFDASGNALWNNAVTLPFTSSKNSFLRAVGSILVANQSQGARTAKAFAYIQCQGHSGGAVYIRNPRAVRAAAANSKLGADGRGLTSTLNSTNGVAGVRSLNLTGFQLSFTDTGGGGTVNVSASTYALDTGVTINYPSGSFPGAAYSTTYYVWRSDPQLNGGVGYGISTNLNDALAPGNVYLGFITTPSAGGTGGGGGGFGAGNCVGELAWVEVEGIGPVQAKDVLPRQHRILCLTEDKLGFEFVEVESNEPGENDMVELAVEFGPRLQLAINTPMPRQDTDEVYGIAAWAHLSAVATKDLGNDDSPIWMKPTVHAVGRGPCQQIVCHQRIYAAGAEPGRYIFSHNGVIQKP